MTAVVASIARHPRLELDALKLHYAQLPLLRFVVIIQGDHSSWKVMENSQGHGKSWKVMENDDDVLEFFCKNALEFLFL